MLPHRQDPGIQEDYLNFIGSDRGVDCYGRFKKLIYGEADCLVDAVLDILFKHLDSSRVYSRVCDLGGGDGLRVLKLIQSLRLHEKSQVTYTCIEQSAALCERCLGNVKRYQVQAAVKNARWETI